MLQHLRIAALGLGLCACAQRAAAPAAHPAAEPEAPAARDAAAATELRLDANYADLVRLAAQRDGQPAQDDRCLLKRGAHGLSLAGPVTTAVRPLPLPDADLDAVLDRAGSVTLLSVFGRYGDAPGALTLVAYSAAPPAREAAALVVTDQGMRVRGTHAGALPADHASLEALLPALDALRGATLFVAAEAHVPLRELARVLDALRERGHSAVLAVNLAFGTALPAPRPARGDALCPAGLVELDEPAGELSVTALQAGASQLRESAAECLGQGEARAAAGGKLTLALRIGPDGRVATACVRSDETEDAQLRACVLGHARALTFAAPDPRGSVDVELPLALRAQAFAAPALLCLQ